VRQSSWPAPLTTHQSASGLKPGNQLASQINNYSSPNKWTMFQRPY